jgi:flagellar motor switch protein FliG
MMDFEEFEEQASYKPLTPPEKAAAVLLSMGKGVASKLLKFFTQHELQVIIRSAQNLRSIPPHELIELTNEFEDLFTEGAGLMDNAKAMESILEEGLTPEEVDNLLGRRATFQGIEAASIWEELGETDPLFVANFLEKEHPQTAAYILSMVPSSFGAKVLMELSEERRADVINRTVNLKQVSPKAAEIIETRVVELMRAMDAEKNATGTVKVAELMNELEKEQVEQLLGALESLSKEAAEKVRPRIFLFEDLLTMPQRGRVTLFNDISADVITMALRRSPIDIREAVLSAIGARQRRMIESDLGTGTTGINPRDIAVARRSIAQEAIRLANNNQIELKEKGESSAAA